MEKRKPAFAGLLVAVAIVTAVGLVWHQLHPGSSATPNVSLTFCQYTTNASGARGATFVLTNLHHTAVRRWIMFSTRTHSGSKGALVNAAGHLEAGASETFTVWPQADDNWRVELTYYPDGRIARLIDTVKTMVRTAQRKRPPFHEPYQIHSDWTEYGDPQPSTTFAVRRLWVD